jgi:hypothetical protein
VHLPPKLEFRTLRLSPEVAGFEYQYQVCVKSGLFGNCRKWEKRVEVFDLNDVETRKMLINMGFVARVRDKVVP